MIGLTGLIKFDTAGYRSDFELEIIDVGVEGVAKIGIYNTKSGMEWIPKPQSTVAESQLSLRNTTFRVLIALVQFLIFYLFNAQLKFKLLR